MSIYTDIIFFDYLHKKHKIIDVPIIYTESLSCIADIWRPIDITDDLNWKQLEEINFKTLEKLAKRSLLKTNERDIRTIVSKWLFPLHGLDIRILKVDKNSLREIRDDKFFDLYY